jgi:hypothetical protein
MSVELLDHVCVHHYPDRLRKAAERVGFRKKIPDGQRLDVSLAVRRSARTDFRQAPELIGGPDQDKTGHWFLIVEIPGAPESAQSIPGFRCRSSRPEALPGSSLTPVPARA